MRFISIIVFSILFFFINIRLCCANLLEPFDFNQIDTARKIVDFIKKDISNRSYTNMIDSVVMTQNSLDQHAANAPYFYTDNRDLISEIVSEVVENPDGVINDIGENGKIGLYRDFDFDKDIVALFVKEKRLPNGYDGYHLGASFKGPTNRVVVYIKIEGITSDGIRGAQFMEAYPQSKGLL